MSDSPEPEDDAEIRAVERTGAHEPLAESERRERSDVKSRPEPRAAVPVLDFEEDSGAEPAESAEDLDDAPTPIIVEDSPAPVVAEDSPAPVIAEDSPAPVIAEDPPAPVIAEDPPAPNIAEDPHAPASAGGPPAPNIVEDSPAAAVVEDPPGSIVALEPPANAVAADLDEPTAAYDVPPEVDEDELDAPTAAEARPDLAAAAEALALLSLEEVAALQAVLPADGEQTAAFDAPANLFANIPDPEDEPQPQSLVLGSVEPAARAKFQQAETDFVPVVRPIPIVVTPVLAPRAVPQPAVPQPAVPIQRKAPPTPPPEPSEPSVILDLKFDEAEGKTGIFEPDRVGDELPRGRLVVQGGPDHGKTWYLNRARTQVGRGTENDIVLLDIAVSREHARFDRHGDGFRLVDLDSGNGSYVNGRRVTRNELYDGDRVEFGEIAVEFSTIGDPRVRLDSQPAKITDPSIVVEAQHAPVRRYPVAWLLAWVVLTFLAVFGAIYATRQWMRPTTVEATSSLTAQAQNWIQRAEEAVGRREWSVARQNVEVAHKLAPELPGYGELIGRVDRATADENTVQAARTQLNAADPASALATLAGMSANSDYAKEAKALQGEARAAQRAGILKSAESALERGENESAKNQALKLLALAPENERAKAIVEAIDAQNTTKGAPEVTAPDASPDADPDAGAAPEPEPDEDVERAKREMSAGLRHYKRGRFADAVVAYERAAGRKTSRTTRTRARRNARSVQDFSRAWKAGVAAADSQKSATAARSLEEARALDRRLGGYYRAKINEKLSGVYYFQAISAFSRQRYADALRLNKKVLKLNSKHPLAGNLARKLTETAKNLLSKAKSAPPERRTKLAKLVMSMTAAGSPTHEAAKNLLAR